MKKIFEKKYDCDQDQILKSIEIQVKAFDEILCEIVNNVCVKPKQILDDGSKEHD